MTTELAAAGLPPRGWFAVDARGLQPRLIAVNDCESFAIEAAASVLDANYWAGGSSVSSLYLGLPRTFRLSLTADF